MFESREQAAELLASRLSAYRGQHPLVLGIPRGAVVMASIIARELEGELDVVLVHKLRAPQQPELAIGAIAPGASVLRTDLVEMLGLRPDEIERITERERRRAEELEARLRHGREPHEVAGRTAVVVDDGLATGATATAAVRSVRTRGPARIVLAVPVAAPESVSDLAHEVEEIVTVLAPHDLYAVGLWYEAFPQLSDEEVEAMLDERAEARPAVDRPAGGKR